MPGASEPRRSMDVIAHHEKALEDEFLAKALLRLESPRWESLKFALDIVKQKRELTDLRGGFSLLYPHPNPRWGGTTHLSVVVRQSTRFQLSNSRMASIPLLDRERDNWIRIGTEWTRLAHTDTFDASWFIEKVHAFLPAFEPDFACGDTDVMLANRFGDDPRRVVWPLAYYGVALVEELGREKLLSAPAWSVVEDARGGVWLQVLENPFVADKTALNAVAAHLGLVKR